MSCICRGADVSACDKEKCTPLILAAKEGHVEAFAALLERGASIEDIDHHRNTVVHIASVEDHRDLLSVSIITSPCTQFIVLI